MRSFPSRAVCTATSALVLLAAGCGSKGDAANTADAITGTGYSVLPPKGWSDRTAEASQNTSIKPDRLLAGPTVDAVVTNANVVFEPAPSKATIAEVGQVFRRQVTGIGASAISAATPRKVAGDDAVTYTYELKQGGPLRRARQVAVIHGKRLYTVSLTASAKGFADAEQRFTELLDSWKWR